MISQILHIFLLPSGPRLLIPDPMSVFSSVPVAPGPDSGNSAHSLSLPPTSQRSIPSLTVISVVAHSLPAAHTFLHNKNAFILLPPSPFKLSVPRRPQRALFSSWCLLSVDSRLPQGMGWGWWRVGDETLRASTYTFHCMLRKLRPREERRLPQGDTESVVEVRLEPKFLCMVSSLFTP